MKKKCCKATDKAISAAIYEAINTLYIKKFFTICVFFLLVPFFFSDFKLCRFHGTSRLIVDLRILHACSFFSLISKFVRFMAPQGMFFVLHLYFFYFYSLSSLILSICLSLSISLDLSLSSYQGDERYMVPFSLKKGEFSFFMVFLSSINIIKQQKKLRFSFISSFFVCFFHLGFIYLYSTYMDIRLF